MILQIQARTDTAIWAGGYATPPAPSSVLYSEDEQTLLSEDGDTLIAE